MRSAMKAFLKRLRSGAWRIGAAGLVLALLWTAFGALLLAPAHKDSAYLGDNIRDDIRIPAADGHYSLALTILRPRGDGPFGAIVLNHGVGGGERERFLESPALFIQAARAFVKRDYVVVMPLRRGFGETGGEFAEDAGECSSPHYRRGERAAASDVLAAYEFARKLPYVDPERMLLAGQSAGAVASLYAASEQPAGLMAVLAFAAGRGGGPPPPPPAAPAAETRGGGFSGEGQTGPAPRACCLTPTALYFRPAPS